MQNKYYCRDVLDNTFMNLFSKYHYGPINLKQLLNIPTNELCKNLKISKNAANNLIDLFTNAFLHDKPITNYEKNMILLLEILSRNLYDFNNKRVKVSYRRIIYSNQLNEQPVEGIKIPLYTSLQLFLVYAFKTKYTNKNWKNEPMKANWYPAKLVKFVKHIFRLKKVQQDDTL